MWILSQTFEHEQSVESIVQGQHKKVNPIAVNWRAYGMCENEGNVLTHF